MHLPAAFHVVSLVFVNEPAGVHGSVAVHVEPVIPLFQPSGKYNVVAVYEIFLPGDHLPAFYSRSAPVRIVFLSGDRDPGVWLGGSVIAHWIDLPVQGKEACFFCPFRIVIKASSLVSVPAVFYKFCAVEIIFFAV